MPLAGQKAYQRITKSVGTPCFLYSEAILKENIRRIQTAIADTGLEHQVRIYGAYFTNSNPHLFTILHAHNVGILLQTIEEWYQLQKLGLHKSMLTAVPTSLPDKEIDFFLKKNVKLYVSSPAELVHALSKSKNVGVRIDLSFWQKQRTGFKLHELDLVKLICKRLKKEIYGIHTYCGTGSNFHRLVQNARKAFKIYQDSFPQVKEINLGGGFPFDYTTANAEKQHFPWNKYFQSLKRLMSQYKVPNDVVIALEPGRDLFADAGELLLRVQRIRRNPAGQYINVYTDGSFVYMPSATVKKRKHHVLFLSKTLQQFRGSEQRGKICGSTTLSSDYVLPHIVKIPGCLSEGDYVLIRDSGAYGACQHMEFLNKRPAPEVLRRENDTIQLLTRRGNWDDRIRYLLTKPKRL